MAAEKAFVCAYGGNEALYLFVQRISDGYWLQAADGSFAAGTDSIPMTAALDDGMYVGYYEHVESREVWKDGWYRVAMAASLGGGVFRSVFARRMRIMGDILLDTEALAAVTSNNAIKGPAATLERMEKALAAVEKSLSVVSSRLSTIELNSRGRA